MSRILHLLTRGDDELAREIIRRQEQAGETVEFIDLNALPSPDYDALLTGIFAADSVQVW